MEDLFKDIYTFNDLNDILDDNLQDNDNYDEYKDIAYEWEEKCTDYLRRRNIATSTSINDEIAIEEDYVKSAIDKIKKI